MPFIAITTPWCADCGAANTDHTHVCLQRTAAQARLRDLCDDIAEHDGINTFHWKAIYNDGVKDCKYEYLNEDGTIYSVELHLDQGADLETYSIVVKRNLRDHEGNRTAEWFTESISTMVAAGFCRCCEEAVPLDEDGFCCQSCREVMS